MPRRGLPDLANPQRQLLTRRDRWEARRMFGIFFLVVQHCFDCGEEWFPAIDTGENCGVADRAVQNEGRTLINSVRLEFGKRFLQFGGKRRISNRPGQRFQVDAARFAGAF